MGFKPPFEIGEEVTNAVMTEAFKVGNMGGIWVSQYMKKNI